jgi:hypothetical protein
MDSRLRGNDEFQAETRNPNTEHRLRKSSFPNTESEYDTTSNAARLATAVPLGGKRTDGSLSR